MSSSECRAPQRVGPLLAMLLVLGFSFAARNAGAYASPARSFTGVVATVDVVGKAIEVRTPPSSFRPRRELFVVTDTTEIRVHGRAGSLADVRRGEEVRLTYLPARLPHAAQRIEIP